MDQNKNFLLKLRYGLLVNTDALWVQILRENFNVQEILPRSVVRSNGS